MFERKTVDTVLGFEVARTDRMLFQTHQGVANRRPCRRNMEQHNRFMVMHTTMLESTNHHRRIHSFIPNSVWIFLIAFSSLAGIPLQIRSENAHLRDDAGFGRGSMAGRFSYRLRREILMRLRNTLTDWHEIPCQAT